jgi:hypothetical protein
MKIAASIFKTFFLSLCIIANTHFAFAQTASLLPNGKQQFLDANGKPLTSGTVDFYVPSTTTRKTTWQNSGETISNTNPVVLDAGGRAIIYGDGIYRQVVKDRNGNLIWDQLTSSSGSSSGGGSTATGDGDLVGTIKPWGGMTAPNQYAFTYGQEVSRTTYSVLFTAITSAQGVFCNSGNQTISGLSDTTNFWIGMMVELSCVPAGYTTITAKTPTTVTLTAIPNVTANITARFFPWGSGNHSTTFNLPDFRGIVPVGNNNMGGSPSANLTKFYYGATDPNSSGAAGGSQTSAFVLTTPNLPPYTPSGTNAASSIATNSNAVTGTIAGPGTAQTGGGTGVATGTGFSNSSIGGTANAQAFTGTAQGGLSTPITMPLIQPSKTTNYIIKITPDANSATASGVTSIQGMTGDLACGSGLTCTGNIITANAVTNTTTLPKTPQDFGAKGDGVTDDTLALIDWATDSGTNNHATYCPPGTYLTTRTINFMPYQPAAGIPPNTWNFDKRCIIKATASMKTLMQFGSSAADFSGILRKGLITGGVFDANFQAQVAVFLPFYNDAVIDHTEAMNALARHYRFGDANAPQSSYGMVFKGDTFRNVAPVTISNITKANPAVVTTATNHGLQTNQIVFISNVGGMTQVNNKYYRATVLSSTTLQLNATDSTGFSNYTTGGTTNGAPSGATVMVPVSAVTNANPGVVTTSVAHGFTTGQKIKLYGASGMPQLDGLYTATVISATQFSIATDTTAFGTYTSKGTAFLDVQPINISAVTNANPAQVTTSSAHGLSTGNAFIEGLVGLGGNIYGSYNITVVDATHFTIDGVDSTSFGAYVSGGSVITTIFNKMVGVCFEHGGDNYTQAGVVSGAVIGVGDCAGNVSFDGSYEGTHVFNFSEQGPITYGFDVGGDMKLVNLQMDGPFIFGFRFKSLRNSLTNSNTNYGVLGDLNNVAYPIRIESGGGVTAVNNNWKSSNSGQNLAADAAAPSADLANYSTFNNKSLNVTTFISQSVQVPGALLASGPRVVPPAGSGIFMDYNGLGGANSGAIQAYDYGTATPKTLAINPFGGSTLFGAIPNCTIGVVTGSGGLAACATTTPTRFNGATPSTVAMAGATKFFGPAGVDTVANNSGFLMTGTCTITGYNLASNVAPGAGDSYTVTLMVDASASAMTSSYSGAATFGTTTTGSVAVGASSQISLRIVGTATAATSQFRYGISGTCS